MHPDQAKSIAERAAQGVRQALRGTIRRVNAAKRVMLAQVDGLAGESFQDIELYQLPGFRGNPLAGRQVVVMPLNGKSSNAVVVSYANGELYITDLAPGETTIFNETDGHSVTLRNGKLIEVKCDTLKIDAAVAVQINTPTVAISHAVTVGTTLTAATDVIAAGKSGAHHTHRENGAGAQTNQPT